MSWQPNPFLRPDSPDYGEIFADGIVHLLARQGLDRWSVGGIARWMKVTPPAVLGRYSRAQVVELMVSRFARRWVHWAAFPDHELELPAALPGTDDERNGVRVWWLLGELTRSERLRGRDAAEQRYVAAQRDEAALLARTLTRLLGRAATPREVLEAAALVTGLRALLVQPAPAVTVADAQELLQDQVARLRAGS